MSPLAPQPHRPAANGGCRSASSAMIGETTVPGCRPRSRARQSAQRTSPGWSRRCCRTMLSVRLKSMTGSLAKRARRPRPQDPSALVEPDGRGHGSAVSPPPGASASARECRVLPPSVGRPSGPQAPPENLLPGRSRSAAVQQALPLLPLLLNVSLLVPLPQASEQPSEKDTGEDCKSKQDRGAHGILPFLRVRSRSLPERGSPAKPSVRDCRGDLSRHL
jgi:hypothetical protein